MKQHCPAKKSLNANACLFNQGQHDALLHARASSNIKGLLFLQLLVCDTYISLLDFFGNLMTFTFAPDVTLLHGI